MPNWCSNSVVFYGENAEKVKDLFRELKAKQLADSEHKGVIPDFILNKPDTLRNPYMFEIDVTSDSINYNTKWSPNTDDLVEIASKYSCDFEHWYDESGNCIYGKATYKDGNLNDIYLDEFDFDKVVYDEKNDIYIYNGETSESSYDFYNQILNTKLTNRETI